MITQRVNPDDPVLGFAHEWVRELSKHLEELYVICYSAEHSVEIPQTVLYQIAPRDGMMRITKALNFYKSALSILRHDKIDGIFVHQIPLFAVLIYPIAKIKSLPVILWYTHGHISLTLRIAGKLVNKILTATKESCRLESSKIKVIGHGITIKKFSSIEDKDRAAKAPRKTKKVLAVGRFSPSKDYETLINAVRYLVIESGMHDMHLILIGNMLDDKDRAYYSMIRSKITEYQLNEWITVQGAVSYQDIQHYYHEADIVISTSRTGSLDKVIVEAMASRKPVITCLPLSELFGPYGKDLMFTSGDDRELSKKIVDVLGWDELRRKEITDYFFTVVNEQHSLTKLMNGIIVEFQT